MNRSPIAEILVGPPHLVRAAVGLLEYLADPPAQKAMGYPLPWYPRPLTLWWCTSVDRIRPELRDIHVIDVADMAEGAGWDDEYVNRPGLNGTPLPDWAGMGMEP